MSSAELRASTTSGVRLPRALVYQLSLLEPRVRTRCLFRFTSPLPICASLVAVLAARRERSGDFCRALLEAAERGGHTRDHRKNAPVGAPEVPQVVLLRACA